MGAVVRVTGSGLGCPDWPLCHGRLLPPADVHAIVEYVHRTIAALVGLPLALTFLAAWRSQRRDLPPMLVAVHLAIALTIVALAIVVATTAVVRGRAAPPGAPSRFPRALAWTAVGLFFLLLTGAYTRASGASWVCPGFPLCAG